VSDPAGAASGVPEPFARTVLVVLAHPDDEALACGGTIALLADRGARVVLICASRCDLGSVSESAMLDVADVATVRAGELTASARTLGIAEVIPLDQGDGCLRWAERLDDELLRQLRRVRPDVVVTFDADGLYWHPDHIGVHERTTAAVRAYAAECPASPPTLYYVTMPEGAMRGLVDAAHARGGAPDGAGLWGIEPDAFGVHAPPATLRVDVSAVVDRKLAAIRCHRTQVGPGSPFRWIDDAGARRWLSVELFRRAPLDASAAPETLLEPLGERMAG
jgi:N-acetyl-1-D-myo-inositol-2-amino-2-deoxy-alpha-D-glucopyranoside deacetylase